MKTDEKLVRQYFGLGEGTITKDDIMDKERMKEHMDWHKIPENKTKSGNYGERFLLFHKQYIEKFDNFRISNGYLPVSSWDPSTKIPDWLAHEGYIEKRFTDDPTGSDPLCRTPTWLTLAGGSDPDPKYGYTALYQFRSIDELGWAIDPIYNSWHNRIHNTIGGDMQEYHSPIDPIFWPWHKWVDEIRATWWTWRVSHAVIVRNLAAFLERIARLLRDTDVPAMRGEKTATEPPHFPFLLYDSRSTIDALMGLVINQISYQISDSKSSESLRKIAIKLLNNAAEHISVQSVNPKSKEIEKAIKSK
jgi:hypothetical protein